jgi:hypothetical protein
MQGQLLRQFTVKTLPAAAALGPAGFTAADKPVLMTCHASHCASGLHGGSLVRSC